MKVEELMMQALDGTIDAADRARLDAYLAERPTERAAFERMLAVDAALRWAPAVAPPADFAAAVVARARTTSPARPIKRRYIVALVVANWTLTTLVWTLIGITLVGLGALLTQHPLFQPIFAFGRGVTTSLMDMLGVLATTARSLTAQPGIQLVMLGAAAIVAIWLSVMVRVLLPLHKPA